MTPKPGPPPKGLQGAGKTLWTDIVSHWSADGLEPDARELRTLSDACSEADMLAILQTALADEISAGRLIVKGSQGQPVTSSLVAQCRSSRAQITALLGKLGMEVPAESQGIGRGGRTTSWQARDAASRRHRGA